MKLLKVILTDSNNNYIIPSKTTNVHACLHVFALLNKYSYSLEINFERIF